MGLFDTYIYATIFNFFKNTNNVTRITLPNGPSVS